MFLTTSEIAVPFAPTSLSVNQDFRRYDDSENIREDKKTNEILRHLTPSSKRPYDDR